MRIELRDMQWHCGNLHFLCPGADPHCWWRLFMHISCLHRLQRPRAQLRHLHLYHLW
jgi:hypothetical protein